MNSHGINILNGTYNNHIVSQVPYKLKLIPLSPQQGLLNQNLTCQTSSNSNLANLLKLFPIVSNPTTRSTERKSRPGLMISENSLISLAISIHSLMMVPIPESRVLIPMFFIVCLNKSLSSTFLIVSSFAESIPHRFSPRHRSQRASQRG
ncbi:hypothetical protein AAHE18_17G129900 [Arachis hypogaea]